MLPSEKWISEASSDMLTGKIGSCPASLFHSWNNALNALLCMNAPCSYPIALAMVASGAVDVKPLITHHFPLENTLDAFETARTGAGGAVKVMIDCFKK